MRRRLQELLHVEGWPTRAAEIDAHGRRLGPTGPFPSTRMFDAMRRCADSLIRVTRESVGSGHCFVAHDGIDLDPEAGLRLVDIGRVGPVHHENVDVVGVADRASPA